MKTMNLTIIMSVRIDSQERLANLLTTVRYYLACADVDVIIVESDTESKCGQQVLEIGLDRVQHVFVYDQSPILHRTKYMNYGFRRVHTTYAANIDSDIIVPREQLYYAYRLISQFDHVMVIPYDGRCIMVGEDEASIIRKNVTHDQLVIESDVLMFGKWSVGGAYLVNVNKYKDQGWENENIAAWGLEDAERVARVEILGCRPVFIPGVIYHLYHPRGLNSYYPTKHLALTSKREYCKVCSMMPDELKEYVKTWTWIY